jgi:hypothetical protein
MDNGGKLMDNFPKVMPWKYEKLILKRKPK